MRGGRVDRTGIAASLDAFASYIRRPARERKQWQRVADFIDTNPAAAEIRAAIVHDAALESIVQVVIDWKLETPAGRAATADARMERILGFATKALALEGA